MSNLKDKAKTYHQIRAYVHQNWTDNNPKLWVKLSDAEVEIQKLKDENAMMNRENIQFTQRNAFLELRLDAVRQHLKDFPMMDEHEGYPFSGEDARKNLMDYVAQIGKWQQKHGEILKP